MAVTEKVSVALGREELRLARRAAAKDGVSLSAFLTGAVRARLAEEEALLSFWSRSTRAGGSPRTR